MKNAELENVGQDYSGHGEWKYFDGRCAGILI